MIYQCIKIMHFIGLCISMCNETPASHVELMSFCYVLYNRFESQYLLLPLIYDQTIY